MARYSALTGTRHRTRRTYPNTQIGERRCLTRGLEHVSATLQEENMFRRTSCHYHDEQFNRDTDRYTPDKTALLNAEARQQSRRDDRLASTRGGAACSPRGNDR